MALMYIKITQCHYLVSTFLQNRTTDFDETLHVAWVWLPEGFSNCGRSGYSPVPKKGGLRRLSLASKLNFLFVTVDISVANETSFT